MAPSRWVYPFDSDVRSPDLVGVKGSSLARMSALGAPIPPGFTIATPAWTLHRERGGGGLPDAVTAELEAALTNLEWLLDRRFDEPGRSLLVSVRSGAPVPMPGMMDTILNVGLTDSVVEALARQVGDRFAWEIYVNLLERFATVVREIDEAAAGHARRAADALPTGPERAATWKALIADHGPPFPQRARDQLHEAILAVWRSWDGPRAARFRRRRGIAEDLGTAAIVQAMVFGNLDGRSGTGVVFSRDPVTGRPGAYGDFLPGAQGEELLAGARTPELLEDAEELVPEALAQLRDLLAVLENSYRDMCDIEFTVESGRLWILQARVAQRSGAAAVIAATDMVDEGLIDIETAIDRIPLAALEQLQAPVAARGQDLVVLGRGTPASPGTAVGRAVFSARRADELVNAGHDVVLIRPETSPRDISGMIAARGIVTAHGGRASHAAVVAREIGLPAVCGIAGLRIEAGAARAVLPSGAMLDEGDVVTVDGTEGTVMLGAAQLVPPQPDERVARLLAWCDERARTAVLDRAPAGFVRVSSPEEAGAAGDRVLVDVPWEGPDSMPVLAAVCQVLLLRDPPPRLLLAVPEALRGADLRPPCAPWGAIVATPRSTWAARALSARLPASPPSLRSRLGSRTTAAPARTPR
jgi:pyruvate,orthophosphate dikinase